MKTDVNAARGRFLDVVNGMDPQAIETQMLSIGREFLPKCVLDVLEGAPPNAEYFDWLTQQVEQMRDEDYHYSDLDREDFARGT